jgi:NDP-sugar pyrophosphorylase family protein
MDAILLAGGVPGPGDPLYPYTRGEPKAAIPIGDQPMIQWVVDALEEAAVIEDIVVVGCQDLQDQINSTKILEYQPAAEDIILNFQRGAEVLLAKDPRTRNVAVVSSDIPLITPQGIEWVVHQTKESDHDLYYFVITQERMEEIYPDSGRSYTKLKDMNVCGGDLSVINLDLYKTKKDFWRKVFQARKSSLRQAALIGLDILLLLLLRQLTLQDTVKRVTKRLGISGQGLTCPYPEIGMDIDKPHQLAIARRELT